MNSDDTVLRGPKGIWLDLATGRVGVEAEPVALTRRQLSVLTLLLRRRGEVVPFADLMKVGHMVSERDDSSALHTAIYRIRHLLAAAGAPDVIGSRRAWGYQVSGDDGSAIPRSLVDAVLSTMKTPALVVDGDGVVVFANDAACDTRKIALGDRPSGRSLTVRGVHKTLLEVAGQSVGTLYEYPSA